MTDDTQPTQQPEPEPEQAKPAAKEQTTAKASPPTDCPVCPTRTLKDGFCPRCGYQHR